MTSLVTGCAGFIGSHLTESLLADGEAVVGLDCFNDNYGREQKLRNLDHLREHEEFTFVPADLADADLSDLVGPCRVVYHLAAEPGVRPSWEKRFERYVRNNVLATQRLLEAVRQRPASTLVYVSSSSVYGQANVFPTPEAAVPVPMSPYGVTKLSAEHLCDLYGASFGLQIATLRLFSVYGPRQRPDMALHRFLRAALEGRPIEVYGDGSQTRDFTFVGDVVAAARAAAQQPAAAGRVFNVGAGSRTSVSEMIRLVGELANGPLEILYRDRAPGDVRDTGADGTRARVELGFEPTTSFRDGVAAQFDWMKTVIAS